MAEDSRITQPQPQPQPQARALESAEASQPLLLSDITLWEIATLQSLGPIAVRGSLRDWLEQAASPPLVRRLGISPAIAAEVASLPDTFHRDPADRILVATAFVHGAVLLTQDQRRRRRRDRFDTLI